MFKNRKSLWKTWGVEDYRQTKENRNFSLKVLSLPNDHHWLYSWQFWRGWRLGRLWNRRPPGGWFMTVLTRMTTRETLELKTPRGWFMTVWSGDSGTEDPPGGKWRLPQQVTKGEHQSWIRAVLLLYRTKIVAIVCNQGNTVLVHT